MLPLAPGLFSTTTGCFQRSESLGASTRARMSMPVPVVNGTTRTTGREGKDWANAFAQQRAKTNAMRLMRSTFRSGLKMFVEHPVHLLRRQPAEAAVAADAEFRQEFSREAQALIVALHAVHGAEIDPGARGLELCERR